MTTRRPVLVDISQRVSEAIAVWPGDTPFSHRRVMAISEGASCDVGTVTMSLHTGTHADAPAHYLSGEPGADELDLTAYIGPCRVVATNPEGAVSLADLEQHDLEGVERLLIRTGSAEDPNSFNPRFASLAPPAATRLAQLGMRLIGLDTPSMDAFESKSLDSHKILHRGGVAILENLSLAHVQPGDYELIALPLRLSGLDASPVRAVLRR